VGESIRLVDLVQSRIDDFLDARSSILVSVAPELGPIGSFSRQFLSGGKRFRALFCYWGWEAVRTVRPEGLSRTPEQDELRAVVGAASALEVFHAAALVHDDIIDNSDTRRGAPSTHRRFEALHSGEGWDGDAATFGTAAATLLGDMLLGWSDELLDESIESIVDRPRARAARREFNTMRTEVTAGQYLDILEERSWRSSPEDQLLARAQRVIVYKSAKYSIEAPLAIGAALAGASVGQADALREYGLPLGIAYQLRDDLLGVFGDPAVTGKPSGDDLREGKRTVLIALARRGLPTTASRLLDELLGDPHLDDDQVRMLQNTITASGATERVEQLIADHVSRARAALDEAPLGEEAIAQLRSLTESVTARIA
jgi:geranylgeranyl diphosphate synthase, type I